MNSIPMDIMVNGAEDLFCIILTRYTCVRSVFYLKGNHIFCGFFLPTVGTKCGTFEHKSHSFAMYLYVLRTKFMQSNVYIRIHVMFYVLRTRFNRTMKILESNNRKNRNRRTIMESSDFQNQLI